MAARNGVLIVMGLYYALTGIWSVAGVNSFQKITGPKVDVWLVKTVGVLVIASGAVMLFSGLRRRRPVEVAMLAAGSAVGLAAIDVNYVARRRISPVYLLDALAQGFFIVALALRGR